MKFTIDGTTYDADEIGEISGRDMMAMSKQADMGIQTWNRTMQQVARLTLGDDGEIAVLSPEDAERFPERCDPNLVTESERHLRAFLVTVWLAQRMGGQPSLTFADSSSIPFRKIDIDLSEPAEAEPDEGAVEDPTEPSASAPGADGQAVTSTQPSTD